LPTPPHDDAVASGSELAPPLPPGDFHPQAIAHAGRTQGGVLRAPRARRQRRALPLSGPPGARRATPVKRANRLALTRRRPGRHAAVVWPAIVLLAATASRAALRAVASCRPLTQRPLPRVLAPASRTERTRTFSGTAVLTGVSDRWSRAD